MGRGEVYAGFWWGKPEGKNHSEEGGVDGKIKLIWIFRKRDVGHGLDRAG
jgi:hypothetical protein